jgi:hypothetical protein
MRRGGWLCGCLVLIYVPVVDGHGISTVGQRCLQQDRWASIQPWPIALSELAASPSWACLVVDGHTSFRSLLGRAAWTILILRLPTGTSAGGARDADIFAEIQPRRRGTAP